MWTEMAKEFKWELGIAIFGLTIVMIVSMMGIGSMRAPSEYTGVVADAEIDRGIVFRTSQARVKTDAEASTFEEFCIPDGYESRFRELAKTQQKVTITYSRPLIVPKWKCQNGLSIVQDVQEVKGSE